MNAFRKLLLAPFVMGVVSPLAGQAQSLDMGSVNRYQDQQYIDKMLAIEAQMGQVTGVSQFSDVQPTDWAYQALSNLVTKYGCVAGYPNGTFKGKQAMSRYEAAALLNACLDRVTEMTEQVKRLLKEFEKELAVLKAKVDGLETKVADLAATQFSTTTKLKGQAVFWLGTAKFDGANKGTSPEAQVGFGIVESRAFKSAVQTNAYSVTPGGASYSATGTPNGSVEAFTKAATWTGGSLGSDIGVVGQPGTTLSNYVGGTFFTPNLSVAGLRSNGFLNNALPNGTVVTSDLMGVMANTTPNGGNGVLPSGVPAGPSLGGFLIDKKDMQNLVALGNASRALKGGGLIRYSSDVATAPYSTFANTAPGGFTNAGTFTNPLDLSIAEYGTLSPLQQQNPTVKAAARKFLKGLLEGNVPLGEAVSFNYDVRLDLNTSFTGKDLLRTRLRAGNFTDSIWSGYPYPALGAEVAFDESAAGSIWSVDRIFYQFPIGSNFTVTAGPRVRQDDMLAVWPSQYPADTILDFFTYAGAPGTYTSALGAGGGIWWNQDGFSLSASYVAVNGKSSYSGANPALGVIPGAGSAGLDPGGIANQYSGGTGTVQLAYTAPNWNLTAAYAYSQSGGGYDGTSGLGYIPVGTPKATNPFAGLTQFDVNALALSGWWKPSNVSWVPSVSAGWGTNSYSAKKAAQIWGVEANQKGANAQSQSWYVGLQWADALIKGNTFGTAVGQPTFVTGNDGFLGTDESTFAWEIWYKFQVTDNISVTPAFFTVTNPAGSGSNSAYGGVLKTSFMF
ncbi:iron uptake porin [Synechococcus sp. UW140]|uniref:iron uptake porin n=2 Tax=Synechococcus sp. UW140 TaxID=368503 RepID=UPI003137CEEC